MAYILQDGKYVPVTGRAENAVLSDGTNTTAKPNVKITGPITNLPIRNVQEMFKAASYSGMLDGLGGTVVKEAVVGNPIPRRNANKVTVVKGSNNYVSPYEAGQGRSKSEVIAMQKQLGVEADGKWGPKTQAAYEAYANRNAEVPAWRSDLDQAQYDDTQVWDARNDQPPYVPEKGGLAGWWSNVVKAASNESQADKDAKMKAAIVSILGGDERTVSRLYRD